MFTRIRLLLPILLITALTLSGCADAVVSRLPSAAQPVDRESLFAKEFGPIDQQVQVDGGWVLLSPARNGGRELAYFVPTDDSWSSLGKRLLLDDANEMTLKEQTGLAVLRSERDGAPQFAAYQPAADGLKPVDYYTVRAPEPTVQTGHFVLINKELNALWHYEDGELVRAYRVTTGRQVEPPTPTWTDYATNFFTPEGRFTLSNFVQNPGFNALKPGDQSYAGGAPGNPLGTRWMGFEVLNDDNAWIWGIHGTSEPEKIGTWASDGCIRMLTHEAEGLFALLQDKTPEVHIVAR
jgi:lipoprotein-anchoring transpeptidase ErfK/SrfK